MSFNYIIHSSQRKNTEEFPLHYDIDFGGVFHEQAHDKYNIEVISMQFDLTILNESGLIYVRILGLDSMNSIYPNGSGQGSFSPLLPITITPETHSYTANVPGAFSFNACKLGARKRIRIEVLDYYLLPLTNADYNIFDGVANETTWILNLKMTPIIE